MDERSIIVQDWGLRCSNEEGWEGGGSFVRLPS